MILLRNWFLILPHDWYVNDTKVEKETVHGILPYFNVQLINILKDFQITISYVEEDLPFEERQASLADYGFRCRCPKCIEEEP